MSDKPFAFSSEHAHACHDRWIKDRNNVKSGYVNNYIAEDGDLPDDWYNNQCGPCLYYILLRGTLASDWGLCSNPGSPFDGRARFEHDGCEAYRGANAWLSEYFELCPEEDGYRSSIVPPPD